MTFKNYIEEALSLSLGKKYTRLSQGAHKHIYDAYFKGKQRVYYDFDASDMKLELGHTDENMIKFYSNFEKAADIILSSEIIKAETNLSKLKNNPKFNNPKALESIESNLNKLKSLDIVNFLKIDDYKNGTAIDFKGNQWKIGKVFTTAVEILKSSNPEQDEALSSYGKSIKGRIFDNRTWKSKEFKYSPHFKEQYINDFEGALDFFKKDPNRSGNLIIVISRHPYDIAGMSTGRGWRSCMNLIDGCNRHYVEREIAGGTIIAYLASSSDRNLKNPLARALIKRYNDEKGNMMLSVYKTYGSAPPQFLTKIKEILNDDINPKIMGKTAGSIFYRNPYTYPETDEPEVINAPIKSTSALVENLSSIKGRSTLIGNRSLKLTFEDIKNISNGDVDSSIINKFSDATQVDGLLYQKINKRDWTAITLSLLKEITASKELFFEHTGRINSEPLFRDKPTIHWDERPDSETLDELVNSKLRKSNEMYYYGSRVDKEEQAKKEIMLKYSNKDSDIINLMEFILKPNLEEFNDARITFNKIKSILKNITENNYNYYYGVTKNLSNYYNESSPDVSDLLKPGMKVINTSKAENEIEKMIIDKIKDYREFNGDDIQNLNIKTTDLNKLFKTKKQKVHSSILNWLEAKAKYSRSLQTKRKYYDYIGKNSNKIGGDVTPNDNFINPNNYELKVRDVGTDNARIEMVKSIKTESFKISGKFGKLFKLIN